MAELSEMGFEAFNVAISNYCRDRAKESGQAIIAVCRFGDVRDLYYVRACECARIVAKGKDEYDESKPPPLFICGYSPDGVEITPQMFMASVKMIQEAQSHITAAEERLSRNLQETLEKKILAEPVADQFTHVPFDLSRRW